MSLAVDVFPWGPWGFAPLQVDPKLAQIRQLQDELWKLEGPSAEEIQAAKAAAQKVPGSDGEMGPDGMGKS